jgi:hypothetical protein
MMSLISPDDAPSVRGVAVVVLGGTPDAVVGDGSDDVADAIVRGGGAGSPRAGAGPQSSAALDPRRIDSRSVQIGNVAAVASPAAVQIIDTNDDGLADAVFLFTESDFESALRGATPEDGAVGLYFETVDRVHYLVPDISALDGAGDLRIETAALLRNGAPPAAQTAPASPVPAPAAGQRSTTEFLGVHPNPFGGTAMIRFQLATELEVQISIFDLRGAQVRALAAGRYGAGRHEALWDGIDDAGRRLPRGIYLVRFGAGGFARTQKVVLMN